MVNALASKIKNVDEKEKEVIKNRMLDYNYQNYYDAMKTLTWWCTYITKKAGYVSVCWNTFGTFQN